MPRPEIVSVNGLTDDSWAFIRCPGCQGVGTVDRDQFEGRVSIACACGYHETHDLRGHEPGAREYYRVPTE